MQTKRLLAILAWMLAGAMVMPAQELPRCGERGGEVELPRVEPFLWCLEEVVSDDHELAFSALATAPDGTLYATHAARGWVRAMQDSTGDGRPDTPTIVLDGLQRPHALHWYADALYILGDGILYRWQPDSDMLTTVIDDLPAGRGFAMRGLEIYDDYVYIGVPVPCDDCAPEQPLHGTVIRTALDGSDRMIIARGLRYPAAIAVYQDNLWIGDSARHGLLNEPYLDELNIIPLNDLPATNRNASDDAIIPHFGFPYCIGSDNRRDSAVSGTFDCATVTAPAYALETGSTPLDLDSYDSDLFPHMVGELMLTLGGDANSAQIRGYQIVSIETWHEDATIFETMMPADPAITSDDGETDDRRVYDATTGYDSPSSDLVNRRYAGPWPHHPLAVTLSPEGWLYFSLGGTIYTLRPNRYNPCDFIVCREGVR